MGGRKDLLVQQKLWCCWCWDNAVKISAWLTFWSHSLLMTRFPSNIFPCVTKVCSTIGATAWKSFMCLFHLSGNQERYIVAYQYLYSCRNIYLTPPHKASFSLFSSRSIRVLMMLNASRTLPILEHWIRFSMALSDSVILVDRMTLWRNSFWQWVRY